MILLTNYIGASVDTMEKLRANRNIKLTKTFGELKEFKSSASTELVILEVYGSIAEQLWQIQFVKQKLLNQNVVFIVLGDKSELLKYVQHGAEEAYCRDVDVDRLVIRAKFIIKFIVKLRPVSFTTSKAYKIPFWKRLFDIIFAGSLLLALLPLFLVVSILIRLESRGKVFYASKRVGSGYRIFDFYKFRSMYADADKRVAELKDKNQYTAPQKREVYVPNKSKSDVNLIGDEGVVNESDHLTSKYNKKENAFFKIPNDPRITKVGRFIRNTSIDELPQLINVLKGDMSVVGNRPLPMYEAENLTTDKWAQRFWAPSGLTGLWQVTDRAKEGPLSPDSRKQLDIDYANTFNFWVDLKIILKTVPAMLQHENV